MTYLAHVPSNCYNVELSSCLSRENPHVCLCDIELYQNVTWNKKDVTAATNVMISNYPPLIYVALYLKTFCQHPRSLDSPEANAEMNDYASKQVHYSVKLKNVGFILQSVKIAIK